MPPASRKPDGLLLPYCFHLKGSSPDSASGPPFPFHSVPRSPACPLLGVLRDAALSHISRSLMPWSTAVQLQLASPHRTGAQEGGPADLVLPVRAGRWGLAVPALGVGRAFRGRKLPGPSDSSWGREPQPARKQPWPWARHAAEKGSSVPSSHCPRLARRSQPASQVTRACTPRPPPALSQVAAPTGQGSGGSSPHAGRPAQGSGHHP